MFESEKSVCKRDSRNDPTGVALQKPVCFYEPPNSYEVQVQEDGTLVISKRMPLKQAIERVERAGVDDPCEVLDRLVQGGECTVTIE